MSITFIRHAEQQSHRINDPEIIDFEGDIGNFDIIICSPYLRCRQTADILNKNNASVLIDVRLSEYLATKRHKITFHPTTREYKGIPEHKEEWEEFDKRIKDAYTELCEKYSDKKILVVTHGLVVKTLYEYIFEKQKYKRGRDVPYTKGFTQKF